MSFVKLQDGRSTYALDSIRLRNQREASAAPQANTVELYMKEGVLYQVDEEGRESKVSPDVDTTISDRSIANIKLVLNSITSDELANSIIEQLVPKGSLSAFGGTVAPSGWLLCHGQSLSQTEYSDLYAVIGNAYGNGTTGTVYGTPGGSRFNVPDLRGRFLRGVDLGVGLDPDRASRTAAAAGGNTGDTVGSIQGDAVLEHQHRLHTLQDDGGNFTGVPYNGNFGFIRDNGSEYNWQSRSQSGATGVGAVVGTATSENRPKNINVNYIIKL